MLNHYPKEIREKKNWVINKEEKEIRWYLDTC